MNINILTVFSDKERKELKQRYYSDKKQQQMLRKVVQDAMKPYVKERQKQHSITVRYTDTTLPSEVVVPPATEDGFK